MSRQKKETKPYLRDGRAPIPKSETTSKVMRSNKAKNTSPELLFRKLLSANGIRGYRLHKNDLPGRPDIVFTKQKLAIFVNGCYWHRCPYCNLPLPKSNQDFWREKFKNNKLRDKKKIIELEKLGWSVITAWECQIKSDGTEIYRELKESIGTQPFVS
jgi:DNA mismatch endonuclease, patch repair protein